MKYHFTSNEHFDTRSKTLKKNPLINIEDSIKYGWFFQDEIQNLSLNINYLKEISESLEELIKTEKKSIEFGYEAYLIECNNFEAKVFDITEGKKLEASIPFQEIYELIKDWCKYCHSVNKIS